MKKSHTSFLLVITTIATVIVLIFSPCYTINFSSTDIVHPNRVSWFNGFSTFEILGKIHQKQYNREENDSNVPAIYLIPEKKQLLEVTF